MSNKLSDPVMEVFELSATLADGGAPESVISETVTTLSAVFDRPAAVWRRTDERTAELIDYATPTENEEVPWDGSRPLKRPQSETAAENPDRIVADNHPETLNAETLVAASDRHVLGVGAIETDTLRSSETTAVTALATALGAALDRTAGRKGTDTVQAEAGRSQLDRTDGERGAAGAGPHKANADAAAFRRLHELTVETDGFETTVERLLSLGCDHFGLETGMLARIEDSEYAVEGVVDTTGTYEAGTVVDIGETMCAVTVARETTAPLAAADVATTKHAAHPVADGVGAYIGVPVVVDGETYGTVNFSSPAARAEPFRPGEEEFIKHVAQWVGATIERRRRQTTLERDETLLQAIGDPVYALDPAGRFTFLNKAGRAAFGDATVVGNHVSTVIDEEALAEGQRALDRLAETDSQSETVTLELETADGERRIFENQIGLIGGDRSAGTIGVLRDITDRETQRRQLASFQAAIENAADGVAVLEDGEYVYIDQTHVEMYGFEKKTQLLGNNWRRLYDKDEVSRLEREAFPALAADGVWRGTVTGTRPDGTSFPAELSLTQLEDDRVICTVRDIIDRRERERELELKEQAMDEAAVGIEISDVTGSESEVVYVNRGFEALTGYDRTEMLGDPPRKLEGERTDTESITSLRAAIASETAETVELEYHQKDGTPYWARVSVTPIHDESGTLTNIIQVQQDVTELKERQTELRENKNRYQTLLQAAP
ncbi:MAG: PAS sensor histidine kinase, partial [halophilic archaeon J07HX5]